MEDEKDKLKRFEDGVLFERLSNHIKDDDKRIDEQDKKWDRIFLFIESLDKKLDELTDWKNSNIDVPVKVAKLWDFHQQNMGFLSATRLLTAGVGGAIVATIDHFWK